MLPLYVEGLERRTLFNQFDSLTNLVYLARHAEPGSHVQFAYLDRAEEEMKRLRGLFRGLD
jgi:hypothetical protein